MLSRQDNELLTRVGPGTPMGDVLRSYWLPVLFSHELEPDGAPQKAGVAIADIFTGVYAVVAIQAALIQRAQTGRGQQIDMALLDTMTGVLANQALNYFVSGHSPQRVGNAHLNVSPYAVFPCFDGWFILAVGNDGQYQRFCDALGLEELAADSRFATNAGRIEHREPLFAAIGAATARHSRHWLLTTLEAVGVPAGPINSVAEAFADPQVVHRGMALRLDRDGLALPGLRTPIRFSASDLALDRAAPMLGQDDRPAPKG